MCFEPPLVREVPSLRGGGISEYGKEDYMKKRLLLFIMFLVIALYGCSSQQTPVDFGAFQNMVPDISDADPEGKLILALSGEPTFLNPILYTDSESGAVVDLIFNGLVKANESLEIIPDLAKKWTVSDDGTLWTFYLKQNVKFHDGQPFTVDDVLFTFDKIMDASTNTVRRSLFIINGKPIKFTKLDNYTFQAKLPEPFAPFLISMTMGILPKHMLEGKNINKADFNHKPVGTGPFKFVRYKTADHVLLERNNDYYLGKPLLKNIYFKIISDSTVQLAALRRGEIDVAGIKPKDYKNMIAENKVNIFLYDSLAYSYLGYNCRVKPFDDVNVRRALAYAIDKNAIVKTVMKNMASSAFSHSHPVSWAYSSDVETFPFNPSKAVTMLELSGWKLVDGVMTKNGKSLSFSTYIAKGSDTSQKTSTMIQYFLKQIGVKMDIKILEWSSLLKIINSPDDPKKYDAVMMAWSLGLDPDGYSIWHSSQYPSGFNHNGYENAEVDELLIGGRKITNRDARKKIYAEAYRKIADDQPYYFLWYPRSITGVSRRVGGLSKPGPAGIFIEMEKIFVVNRS